jgi:hypothetical protein
MNRLSHPTFKTPHVPQSTDRRLELVSQGWGLASSEKNERFLSSARSREDAAFWRGRGKKADCGYLEVESGFMLTKPAPFIEGHIDPGICAKSAISPMWHAGHLSPAKAVGIQLLKEGQ